MQCRCKLSQITINELSRLETRSVMLRSYSTGKTLSLGFPLDHGWFLQVPASSRSQNNMAKVSECQGGKVLKVEERRFCLNAQSDSQQFTKQSKRTKFSGKRDKSVGKETTKSKKPPCQHWWWWWPWWLDDKCHHVSMLWSASAGFLLTSRGGPPSIIVAAGTENYDNTVIMCTAASSSIHDVRSNVHLFELKHWTSLLDTLWLIT